MSTPLAVVPSRYTEAENLARTVIARMDSMTVKLKSLEDDIRLLWIEFDKLKAGETILGCATKKEFCEKKLNRTPRAIQYMLEGGNHNRRETVSPPAPEPRTIVEQDDSEKGSQQASGGNIRPLLPVPLAEEPPYNSHLKIFAELDKVAASLDDVATHILTAANLLAKKPYEGLEWDDPRLGGENHPDEIPDVMLECIMDIDEAIAEMVFNRAPSSRSDGAVPARAFYGLTRDRSQQAKLQAACARGEKYFNGRRICGGKTDKYVERWSRKMVIAVAERNLDKFQIAYAKFQRDAFIESRTVKAAR